MNLVYRATKISEDAAPMVQVAKKALKSVGIELNWARMHKLGVYSD